MILTILTIPSITFQHELYQHFKALEQEEIQHVKFHSSDAERTRRARLLSLEELSQSSKNKALLEAETISNEFKNAKCKCFCFESSGRSFDKQGIIYYLGCRDNKDNVNTIWENPGKKGVVSVTRSSEGGGEAYHALNYHKGVFPCRTFDAVGSWFCFDFGCNFRVSNITKYSLRMGPGLNRVSVSWILEASTNAFEWIQLDQRKRVWKLPLPHQNSQKSEKRKSRGKSRRSTNSAVVTKQETEGTGTIMRRRHSCNSITTKNFNLTNRWNWPKGVSNEINTEGKDIFKKKWLVEYNLSYNIIQSFKYNFQQMSRSKNIDANIKYTGAYATGTWATRIKKTRQQLVREAVMKLKSNASVKKDTTEKAKNDEEPSEHKNEDLMFRYIRIRDVCIDNSQTSEGLRRTDISSTINLCGFELYGKLIVKEQ